MCVHACVCGCASVWVCMCVCVRVCLRVCANMHVLNFYLFLIHTGPGKRCNSFVSCAVSSLFPLTVRCSFLSSLYPPSWGPGPLAGNKRLQQIITAADPLAIQADVHWTHIREREAEERMLPTSESSTSRGNCLEPQSRVCVQSPHSWPFPWLQRPCLQRDHCPCLSFKNM